MAVKQGERGRKCKKIAKNCKMLPKMVDMVSDTCYYVGMPNKRADNIKRVTITIDDELLRQLEAECKRSGANRLEIIREAIATHVKKQKEQSKQEGDTK